MVLTLLRAHPRAHALAVLVAVIVWGGAIDWGHGGWDDPGCNPGPVNSNRSPLGLNAATDHPASGSNHCDLCHLLRLLHSALSIKSPQPVFLAGAASVGPIDSPLGAKVLATHVASRAPPRIHS